HAVYRRAQLMRHVGEKFGLGLIGRFGLQHALMRLLPRRDERHTRVAALQHSPELRAILGDQRCTSVSATVDHHPPFAPASGGKQCRGNTKYWLRLRHPEPWFGVHNALKTNDKLSIGCGSRGGLPPPRSPALRSRLAGGQKERG